MNRIVVEQRVSDEGILQILLPLGLEEAGSDVRVTIERVDPINKLTPDEWRAGILATAGAWQGEFDLPSEGVPEERDLLS